MKLGLGLYRHMLVRENFQFARQAGATHIVAHLVDYFKGGAQNPSDNQPTGTERGWGVAGDAETLWTLEELIALRKAVEEEGLKLEAIENFDPAHWHDILLDGPKRAAQIENVRTILRRMGEAGIPILGYNFSIAGVCGRTHAPYARGRAMSVGMEGPCEVPMPHGMVWNMVYDPAASPGTVPPVSPGALWSRWERFIGDVLPVAKECGVKLALHPDDPPMPTMRGQSRLVYQPHHYQRIVDFNPSPVNALEFCVGSLGEMTEGDLYQAVESYSRQGKVAYVHCRNVTGKVPYYRETFIDDGDIDIIRVLRILQRNGFDGVVIPDHTPQMTCSAPWHAGMAFALGYLSAAFRTVQKNS
jgi:mannonate dehydratase